MAVERSVEEIAGVLPEARLIAILRDPIERGYSSYLFHRRDGRERRSFEQAIREAGGSVRGGFVFSFFRLNPELCLRTSDAPSHLLHANKQAGRGPANLDLL